ncbi:MAG: acyl--CoA ligase [Lachnospiraceae bacterium]|nr:acyl--CoA ligase [Lachnospiraceae bacterium]
MKEEKTVLYPEGKMVDCVEAAAKEYPDRLAYEFMGRKCTYTGFIKDVEKCAKALVAIGVKEDDVVCISMPNVPQAITFLYAANKIGAVVNMIHPLSSEGEMVKFINSVEAKTILLMDQFYGSIKNIRNQTPLKNVIIAGIEEALPPVKKLPYRMTLGRKIKKIDSAEDIIRWNDLMKKSGEVKELPEISNRREKPALILHSGGTTGKIKGVVLSNLNVNACSAQMIAANPMFNYSDRMLTVMPIFHGNGLVIGVHSMLITGAECILIPRFTPETYAKDLLKYKCNYMSGVPTLFERLMEVDCMKNADLSFLKGVFSGADYLSVELERRINEFLKNHNSSICVRQGYGMTEGVVASSLNPIVGNKEGTIGIPLPDTKMKIVKPGTDEELPVGEVGEIVFSSLTNMMGYWKDQEETAETMKLHSDGLYWIHSGDLGSEDEDGFFHFKGRIKRMIVTNGYNVFPLELENIIEGCPLVDRCCVLGIPDKERVELVKAFIVLKSNVDRSEETKESIKEYCKTRIARYAMPRKVEFLDQLPKTKIGKVDYNQLLK